MNTQPSTREFTEVLPVNRPKEGTRIHYTFPVKAENYSIERHQLENTVFDTIFDQDQKKISIAVMTIISSVWVSWYGNYLEAMIMIGLGLSLWLNRIAEVQIVTTEIVRNLIKTGKEYFSLEDIKREYKTLIKNK